jgi:hypothetical protein
MDVGQSRQFTSVVSNGTSPYSYRWYVNGSAVSGATNSTWTFRPASSGSYTVYLNVTDGMGIIAISLASNVTVIPAVPEFQPLFFLPLFVIVTLLGTLLAAFILKTETKRKNTIAYVCRSLSLSDSKAAQDDLTLW